ncbi:head GIN domain-containing protein [Mucilaginibacter sp.]|uniref:head GIN domain-containing protein n=1 Tax=Mucilaginibacter sp. TaxID=1882438 RepID=UPI003D0EF463
MKRIHLLITLMAAGVAFSSLSACRYNNCVQGSGNQATETRKVADFKRLEVSDSFKVIIKQDSSSTLSITADDNLIKYIRTSVSGDKLRIYIRQNTCNSGEMIVHVPIRMLEEVRAGDASEIEADGKITVKDMYFKLSDAAKVTMALTANHIITHNSDATELNLKGQATSHDIKISDGSKINAADMVTSDVTIQASDAAYGEVNVLNSLNVLASDGAIIKYHGNAPNVNTKKSDAASVEKVN